MAKKIDKDIKKEIIDIGRCLYERDCVSASAGNISVRSGKDIFITRHGTGLGFLCDEDILQIDLSAKVIKGKGGVSAETPMHAAIYKNIDTGCVIHSHPLYVNGYFAAQGRFSPVTFEAQLILGDVTVIEQNTPTVTDITPVVEALKIQNIVVFKNHGVVAIGAQLKDAFSLTELLEDAVKTATIERIWKGADMCGLEQKDKRGLFPEENPQSSTAEKFKLFSREHIAEIVRLVNEDTEIQRLGESTNLTCSLAIKMDETDKAYTIKLEKGRVVDLIENDNADFVISGKEEIWQAVFNRKIDPFAATMQKKLKLKGDFAKLSRWYAPFYKIFDVWKKVEIENT